MFDRKNMPTPSDAREFLARARLARLVSVVFGKPAPESLVRLSDPAVQNELRLAALELGINSGLIDKLVAHADGSVDPAEYERRLDDAGFALIESVIEDFQTGGSAIWLAQLR